MRPTGKDQIYPQDDQFFYLGTHVDKSTKDKIMKGEVDIDFAKLISKKKQKDEDKLDIISREGKSNFLPTAERDMPVINCYEKWEQAFCIFVAFTPEPFQIDHHNCISMVT